MMVPDFFDVVSYEITIPIAIMIFCLFAILALGSVVTSEAAKRSYTAEVIATAVIMIILVMGINVTWDAATISSTELQFGTTGVTIMSDEDIAFRLTWDRFGTDNVTVIDWGVIELNALDKHIYSGLRSTKYKVIEGTSSWVHMRHDYTTPIDMSQHDSLSIFWYGLNTSKRFNINLLSPDWNNRYSGFFIDSAEGWHYYTFWFDTPHLNATGNPSYDSISTIEISYLGDRYETWYMDNMYLWDTTTNSSQILYSDQQDFWTLDQGGNGFLGIEGGDLNQPDDAWTNRTVTMYLINDDVRPIMGNITYDITTLFPIDFTYGEKWRLSWDWGETAVMPGRIREVGVTMSVHRDTDTIEQFNYNIVIGLYTIPQS